MIKKKINTLLSHFNLTISKCTTIDSLHTHKLLAEQHNEIIRHQIAVRWNTIDYLEKIHPNANTTYTCPLCEHTDNTSLFSKYSSHCIFDGGVLVRYKCPKCDLIFGPDKMLSLTEEELSDDYHWHYKVYEEGDSTKQEIKAFYALTPTKEGIYLNYGAGAWSNSIKVLRDEGWNVYGFEPHAENNTNNEYIITNLEQLQEMKFDGIFSNNVLEHLRYPIDDFKMMQGILKNNAFMAHATPCFEYLYEFTRFHLFFYLGNSRQILAEKSGLAIVDYTVEDEFMNLILKKK